MVQVIKSWMLINNTFFVNGVLSNCAYCTERSNITLTFAAPNLIQEVWQTTNINPLNMEPGRLPKFA
jgi:hypothetical protein